MTDGISELDFASIRQAGCDDILGDPAAHVSCAAIYLRRVFSGKRSAAVPSHSAVAITDNLAPGDSSIAFRAADDEPASRVNQIGCFVVDPFRWHHFFDQELDQGFANLLLFHVSGMLRGNDDSRGSNWFVAVVFNRDLRFSIGTQPRNFA